MPSYVLAYITINDSILLVKRGNVAFGKGFYALPGGKIEHGESASHAIQREIFEETGLDLDLDRFSFVHLMHRKGDESEFFAVVFKVLLESKDVFFNKEPYKHDEVSLFSLSSLPHNMLVAHNSIVQCIQSGIPYSEHGWHMVQK